MSYNARDHSFCRSRSPLSPSKGRAKRKRSRSPGRHHHRHGRRHGSPHKPKAPKEAPPVTLPFRASPISKHQHNDLKPMFGLYLDIQKQKILEELPEEEVKGRWKSFVGKWNRGELAEGWYDPATLQKAKASVNSQTQENRMGSDRQSSHEHHSVKGANDESDEDEIGPAPLIRSNPGDSRHYSRHSRSGPAVPRVQDLELQREQEREDAFARGENLHNTRRQDRKQQKERLDELVPRAEAGTKDRLLEKKREKADSNRAFAAGKTEANGVEEVPESDLLGDGEGGIEGFKRRRAELERKKNDRELRKEEMLRARAAEREERVRAYRKKEENTMKGLVALAKARFG